MTELDITCMCEITINIGHQYNECNREATKFYFDGYKFRARCELHSKDNYYNRIIAITKEEFIVGRIMSS